tara:strand:- start:1698 stop:1940 length:243 start_codon:yes stop_codon:yes gene_type:complete
MKEYEYVDLMVEGDMDHDGNEIKFVDGIYALDGVYALCSSFDSGQGQVMADINKLLKFLAENEPALYMKFVSNDMIIAHT